MDSHSSSSLGDLPKYSYKDVPELYSEVFQQVVTYARKLFAEECIDIITISEFETIWAEKLNKRYKENLEKANSLPHILTETEETVESAPCLQDITRATHATSEQSGSNHNVNALPSSFDALEQTNNLLHTAMETEVIDQSSICQTLEDGISELQSSDQGVSTSPDSSNLLQQAGSLLLTITETEEAYQNMLNQQRVKDVINDNREVLRSNQNVNALEISPDEPNEERSSQKTNTGTLKTCTNAPNEKRSGQTTGNDILEISTDAPNEEQSVQITERTPPDTSHQERSDQSSNSEDESLNSNDDIEDDEEDTNNLILCTFDRIKRNGGKWKLYLRSGIMMLKGKEYIFGSARGSAVF